MVKEEFPSIQLVRLPKNEGCAARNRGMELARGDIVVTLDDDIIFSTPTEVRKLAGLFQKNPSTGCITFKVLDSSGIQSRRNWIHPRDQNLFGDRMFFTDVINEGAVAFRKEAFLGTGGYWPPLFIYHEGMDLSLRLLEREVKLLYSPGVSVRHQFPRKENRNDALYRNYIRNALWVCLRNYPPSMAGTAMIRAFLLYAFSAFRAGRTASFLLGFQEGLFGASRALATRRPIRGRTASLIRRIRRERPTFLSRVRKYLQDRPF